MHDAKPTNTESFEVFFDGDCPLCTREIDFLKARDRRSAIRFTDISQPSFDPSVYDMELADFMAQIRGRMPDGTFVEGVEVFRQLYDAVGFHLPVRLSRAPGIDWALNRGYKWFAKNRLRLTGRCEDGVCEIPNRSHDSRATA